MEPERQDETASPEPAIEASEKREEFPFWGYRDLLALAALVLPCLAAAGLLVGAAFAVLRVPPAPRAMLLLAAQFLAYGLWFGCIWMLFHVKYRRPFWESMAWKGRRDNIAAAALAGPPLALLIGFAGAALGKDKTDIPMIELLKDPVSIALVGAFAVTLGPVCEELAFRGIMLPLVTRSFGPVAGVTLSALPFALLHGPQYGWSWARVLLIAVAGAAFGAVRLRMGSTQAAAAMHATYNLTFVAAFLLQRNLGRV